MYRADHGNVLHSYSENWKSCSASLSFVSKELSIRIFFEAMTARVPPRNGYWLTRMSQSVLKDKRSAPLRVHHISGSP